jgi:hypothetical protein
LASPRLAENELVTRYQQTTNNIISIVTTTATSRSLSLLSEFYINSPLAFISTDRPVSASRDESACRPRLLAAHTATTQTLTKQTLLQLS